MFRRKKPSDEVLKRELRFAVIRVMLRTGSSHDVLAEVDQALSDWYLNEYLRETQ